MPYPRRSSLRLGAITLAALLGAVGQAHALPDAPTDLRDGLSSLRTAPMTTVTTLGKTSGGRDIPLITLGDPASRDTNPAILLVAGLNGDHWVGSDVAMGLARTIVADHADLLERTTVYILPRVNIDAAHAHTEARGLRTPRERTPTATDDDRDRRMNEDGPEDLNGDGIITQMRVKNPPPHLKATHILDPDNEGLLRLADASKGEIAEYAVLTEGVDNDGDGAFNEDGPGGVDLDMNFPHLWPEHAVGAGAYALSEPEAHALANFVLDRLNIEAVLAFGPHDTLASIPQAGKMDITGRAPLGIENDDKTHYERISEAFKDATGIASVSGVANRENKGAFWSWAYAQGGAWAFSTPVWVRPDQIKREGDEEEKGADGERSAPSGTVAPAAPSEPEGPSDAEIRAMVAEFEAADDAGKAAMMAEYNKMPPAVQARVMAVAQGQTPPPARQADAAGERASPRARAGARSGSDEAKWLALAQERGEGFVEWEAYDHPQLGAVEIGGFVPGFQWNPPAGEIKRLVGEQAAFVRALADELPRVTLDEPVVERVGPGVFRITVVARNAGTLPSASAIAVKSNAKRPLVLRLEGDEKAILAGERVQRARSIPGGGHERFEWLVAGRDGSNMNITVRSPQTGDHEIAVALRATKEGGR